MASVRPQSLPLQQIGLVNNSIHEQIVDSTVEQAPLLARRPAQMLPRRIEATTRGKEATTLRVMPGDPPGPCFLTATSMEGSMNALSSLVLAAILSAPGDVSSRQTPSAVPVT